MTRIKNNLWISFEDTSPRFGCYGDSLAQTPNVDRLASTGRRWTQATSTASVCSPSRASTITGMYAPTIGCQHMRTSRVSPAFPEMPTPCQAVPPAHVKAFPEYLRAAGYFCTNNGKDDYQFGSPTSIWDINSQRCLKEIESEEGFAHLNAAHWRRRSNPDQPFFSGF